MRIPMLETNVIREVAATVERDFGRCDVLVNSAGFTRMVPHHDLEALDDELIDAIFAANIRGPFAMVRAFAPLMKRSRRRGHCECFLGRGDDRFGQQYRLWRIESGSGYDGPVARSRPSAGDPGANGIAGGCRYRVRAWPDDGDG